MAIEDFFTEAVDIQRTVLQNVDGIGTRSATIVAKNVLCHIQEHGGEIRVFKGTQGLEYDSSAWFDPDTDLRPNIGHPGQTDILIVRASDRIPVGSTFTVRHSHSSPGRVHHVRAYLRRLPGSTGDG